MLDKLDKLGKAEILAKPLAGGHAIEDRLFAEYLRAVELKPVV
ncbi:hypothetical protein [Accumulibacter sp.]|nr:hypothetical protein [Accumulibacter sp.]